MLWLLSAAFFLQHWNTHSALVPKLPPPTDPTPAPNYFTIPDSSLEGNGIYCDVQAHSQLHAKTKAEHSSSSVKTNMSYITSQSFSLLCPTTRLPTPVCEHRTLPYTKSDLIGPPKTMFLLWRAVGITLHLRLSACNKCALPYALYYTTKWWLFHPHIDLFDSEQELMLKNALKKNQP